LRGPVGAAGPSACPGRPLRHGLPFQAVRSGGLASAGEPRARVALRARDIAASMAFDGLRTGYAARKAQRLAAANGGPNDLPAHEQAEARVLSGVTTTS